MDEDIKTKPIEELTDFQKGVRAFFDALICRAAGRYHGNPVVQAQIDKENALINEWAIDALEEISSDDLQEWRSIEDAYSQGLKDGKLVTRIGQVKPTFLGKIRAKLRKI